MKLAVRIALRVFQVAVLLPALIVIVMLMVPALLIAGFLTSLSADLREGE